MSDEIDLTDCKAIFRDHRMQKLMGESVAAPIEERATEARCAESSGSMIRIARTVEPSTVYEIKKPDSVVLDVYDSGEMVLLVRRDDKIEVRQIEIPSNIAHEPRAQRE